MMMTEVDETIAEDFRNDENFLEIMTLQINSLCIYVQARKGGFSCYFQFVISPGRG